MQEVFNLYEFADGTVSEVEVEESIGEVIIEDRRQEDNLAKKSVSRFARNTVDSLTTVRKLKEKGVEVYFEKKDFYTGKVPKNAVKWAFFGTFWCLGGV